MFRVENIESPRSGRPVANQFKEWLEALNNQALFNDLLLKEKERQGVSTK